LPTGAPILLLWRAYVPRWAYQPLSGEGAARFGGRWNPVGLPTIYAARELSTAWAEYNQGFIQHPATIARLKLEEATLADLTNAEALRRLDLTPAIHRCEWRTEMDQGRVPETHRLQTRLASDGFDGVIYPSFMSPGGSCVALWRWNAPGAPKLTAIDPERRLPRTAASWV
jgi:RES domain-containing protein